MTGIGLSFVASDLVASDLVASDLVTSDLVATSAITSGAVILNALLFQATWAVNVLDIHIVAPLVNVLVVATHLLMVRRFFGFASSVRESFWLMLVTAIGLLVERGFLAFDILLHEGQAESVFGVPVWLLLLWLAFATTFRFSLAFLRERFVVAAIFGAFAAASYWGGAALNPFSRLGDPSWGALLWIALVWAATLPTLVLIHKRFIA